MTKTTYAWAIDTNDDEVHGFIGVFWFLKHGLEPCQDGMRTALFRTRKQAREHLMFVRPKEGYHAFPKAKVVKVRIDVATAVNRHRPLDHPVVSRGITSATGHVYLGLKAAADKSKRRMIGFGVTAAQVK